MYGGTVDGQNQSSNGGGIVAATTGDSAVEIYGGTILGGSVKYGSGIYSQGTAKLLGGTVTGGKSDSGAVYMAKGSVGSPMLYLGGDATVTGNHMANGTTVKNINANAAYFTVTGNYTGTAGVYVSSPKHDAVVAISDNANLSGATLSVDGKSDYAFNVSSGSVRLVDTTKIVVKDSDGNSYTTMAEALNACEDSGATLILQEEITEDITISKDVRIDLVGLYISGEVSYTDGAKVILSDSTTDDFVCGDDYGRMPYSTNVVAADGYLLYTESGAVSAHAYEVQLTSVAQRARVVGMYFGSAFHGDEVVKSMISEFGVSLRVNKAPDASYILADTACKTHTRRLQSDWVTGAYQGDFYGTVVQNIMSLSNTDFTNKRNANLPVFGVSYIKLTDGSFLFGSAYSFTLKELTELSDDQSLTETQLSSLVEMYSQYQAVMADWDIPQIKAAYEAANGF